MKGDADNDDIVICDGGGDNTVISDISSGFYWFFCIRCDSSKVCFFCQLTYSAAPLSPIEKTYIRKIIPENKSRKTEREIPYQKNEDWSIKACDKITPRKRVVDGRLLLSVSAYVKWSEVYSWANPFVRIAVIQKEEIMWKKITPNEHESCSGEVKHQLHKLPNLCCSTGHSTFRAQYRHQGEKYIWTNLSARFPQFLRPSISGFALEEALSFPVLRPLLLYSGKDKRLRTEVTAIN